MALDSAEPRKGRSKRGLSPGTGIELSQVCFKIEKNLHKRLRMFCIWREIEIGEYLDQLIVEGLGSWQPGDQ